MSLENDFFQRSFNFDKSLVSKRTLLLRGSAPHFKTLPVVIINKIFRMLAFIETGFYYHVTDSHQYPNIVNKYVGKCCEIKDKLVKISYSGWNDSFDEWVSAKNITYLSKTQCFSYYIGAYIDILDLPSCEWYKGLIWNINFINNQKILTVIYKLKPKRQFVIVKNIPIYYKYIAPYKRHTFRMWRNIPELKFFRTTGHTLAKYTEYLVKKGYTIYNRDASIS